ncbi:MAG: SMP-30/gluconolactonase/LRE family protein [Acidimicrobiia bacterium]
MSTGAADHDEDGQDGEPGAVAARGPTTVLCDGLVFPEGPRWRDDRLWFSDQHGHTLQTIDLSGNAKVVAEVPRCPSGIGWLPDGTLLVVSMHDHRIMRVDGDGLHEYADCSGHMTGAANDMVVDSHGRAYVGNFGFDLFGGGTPRTTGLVMVSPKGDVRVVAADLHFPNGTVVTPDGATLVVAETMGARLTAFDIAPDGSLGRRREWAKIPGLPDGICLDAEGCIWVCDPGGGDVMRVAEGGEIRDRVQVGGANKAVACALGGPDRRTLFVCTSASVLPAECIKERRGRIECVDVDVPGAGLP